MLQPHGFGFSTAFNVSELTLCNLPSAAASKDVQEFRTGRNLFCLDQRGKLSQEVSLVAISVSSILFLLLADLQPGQVNRSDLNSKQLYFGALFLHF